jgi:hypothetical protein
MPTASTEQIRQLICAAVAQLLRSLVQDWRLVAAPRPAAVRTLSLSTSRSIEIFEKLARRRTPSLRLHSIYAEVHIPRGLFQPVSVGRK